MTKMDDYKSALLELALNMDWQYDDAQALWEGGPSFTQEKCWKDLVDRGYLGDSDDNAAFAQFLYDEQILSVKSLAALDLTEYIPQTYLCIWGDGYICSEPRKAHMAERNRERMLADDSFADYYYQIKNLRLGESFNCIGTCDIMTVVRIK